MLAVHNSYHITFQWILEMNITDILYVKLIKSPVFHTHLGLRVRVRGDPEPAVLPVPLPEAGEGAGVGGGSALHEEHLDGVVEGSAQVHLRARHQQGRPQGRGHRGHPGMQEFIHLQSSEVLIF